MTVWQYSAIQAGGPRSTKRRGEIAGDSAAEVRASLRRIGLQVIDVRPLHPGGAAARTRAGVLRRAAGVLRASRRDADAGSEGDGLVHRALRGRRRQARADLYDGLATMLESGVPLLEAIDALTHESQGDRALRCMLARLREAVRSGDSLAAAMSEHATWFDRVDLAMVRAGQHGGTLPGVLRTLADRQEQASALTNRLAGALTYPVIVLVVGLGVVVFLSVRTLPTLAQILVDAGVEPPGLTRSVMATGQLLAGHGITLLLAAVGVALLLVTGTGWLRRAGVGLPRSVRRLVPRDVRRLAVARAALQLAQLVRTGVPLVEALRVVAPSARGTARHGLRGALLRAAGRLERGDDLAEALADDVHFDTEFRRVLAVGQRAGEIDDLLERIGHRYERRAARWIDRLTTLLEPVVILLLALLVGTVVMAAVLPLLRIQEVLL